MFQEAKAKFQQLLKVYQTLSNPQRRADYDRYGEHEEEERGEEQAEEADGDVEGVPHYWTVEELESLLSELGETSNFSQEGPFFISLQSILYLCYSVEWSNSVFVLTDIAMMQKNMEFERTMDPAYVWTDKIVSKEIDRAYKMGVNEIHFNK